MSDSILASIRKKVKMASRSEVEKYINDNADIYIPRKSEEDLLREEFPSLQDAWEKYQIVLKMVKSSKPKETIDEKAEDILAQIRKRKANSKAVTPAEQRLKDIARKFSK